MSDILTREEQTSLDEQVRAAFATPSGGELVPVAGPSQISVSDAVITAQKVAVERDDAKVLAKIKVMASVAGEDWFYRYPVKNKGQVNWIEGPSIKCANNVARIYGNCQVDTRVFDIGDSWLIYARFVDYETGFSYQRPFQQRKGQQTLKSQDAGRQLDIALQIGVSKAIRNVVCNALETYTNFAFEEAQNSIVDKIGKNLERYRERIVPRFGEMGVDIVRVEATLGRASADWLATDIARLIAQMQSIKDGMATIDETWPAGGEAPPRPTREQFTEDSQQDTGTPGGETAADQPTDQQETVVEEPFEIVNMLGEIITAAEAEAAVIVYTAALDAAEKAKGEAGLTGVWESNSLLFTQLEQRGHANTSRELSMMYGLRRRDAAAREAAISETEQKKNIPRGTTEQPSPKDSAKHPDAAPSGGLSQASQQPRQGAQQQTSASASPEQGKGGGQSARPAASGPEPTGDLLGERDPGFWKRKDGKRVIECGSIDDFMRMLPQRLAECRDRAEIEDIRRHNADALRGLGPDDIQEVAGWFNQHEERMRRG